MIKASEAKTIMQRGLDNIDKDIHTVLNAWEKDLETDIRVAAANGQSQIGFSITFGITEPFQRLSYSKHHDAFDTIAREYFTELGYKVRITHNAFLGTVHIEIEWGEQA